MLETMTIPALFLGCILNLKTIKTKKVQINLPASKTSLHQTSEIIRMKKHITIFSKKFPKSFTCWKRSRFIFRAICAKNLKFIWDLCEIYTFTYLKYSSRHFSAYTLAEIGNLSINRSKVNADGHSPFDSYLRSLLTDTTYIGIIFFVTIIILHRDLQQVQYAWLQISGRM